MTAGVVSPAAGARQDAHTLRFTVEEGTWIALDISPDGETLVFDLLGDLYPRCSNLEIAQKLQRSVKSVVSKAHHLGLKKDPVRLQEMGRENVSLRYRRRDG